MAGLYIHIPFCKQACHYCDFHFSTNQSRKSEMVDSICQEMKMQKKFLVEPVHTIYFGGGTPSLLNADELDIILETANDTFDIDPEAEITLEANPDDLSPEKLQSLYKSGINRLSIGVQSFHNEHLKFLNRAHKSEEAIACINAARAAGFDNISIDLIYAIPSINHEMSNLDIDLAMELTPEHISCYCLTIEPKTVFGNWLKKGSIQPIEESYAAEQFEILIDRLTGNGYVHYEVSNFSKPDKHSRHNSAYWFHAPYLGVGPGAHSFDGAATRQYNISNNAAYIRALAERSIPFETDLLASRDLANEYIMMTLRTKWGCNLDHLRDAFAYDCGHIHRTQINELIELKKATLQNGNLILTSAGKLLADGIASDLFIE